MMQPEWVRDILPRIYKSKQPKSAYASFAITLACYYHVTCCVSVRSVVARALALFPQLDKQTINLIAKRRIDLDYLQQAVLLAKGKKNPSAYLMNTLRQKKLLPERGWTLLKTEVYGYRSGREHTIPI